MVRGHQVPRIAPSPVILGNLTVLYVRLVCGVFECVLDNGELLELEHRPLGYIGL
jgi:hypothetical protein